MDFTINMKNLFKNGLVLVLFSCCFVANVKCQQKFKPLLFIDGMPVKIDGGCSFYVYKKNPLSLRNSQLTIDASHNAFIEFEPQTFIFFKRVKRIDKKNGYIDFFKGKTGSIILSIDSIKRYEGSGTIRSGHLIIQHLGYTQKIKIHGIVQELDRYYYKLYSKFVIK